MMGGRYLITGAQIGTLKALAEHWVVDDFNKIINDIQDNQFIGDSELPMKQDLKAMQNFFETKEVIDEQKFGEEDQEDEPSDDDLLIEAVDEQDRGAKDAEEEMNAEDTKKDLEAEQ